MKSARLTRKTARRQRATRRVIRAKVEQPAPDLSLADPCPHCGTKRFELVDVTGELIEIRCLKCRQTWITLPRNLRR